MIAQLTGKLRQKQPNEVIIEVNGVGYRVVIPLSTYYRLKSDEEMVTLKIYTYVRENTIALYGFLTNKEKLIFEKLISISGLGPKSAIIILSGLPVEELISAVRKEDPSPLSSIPGIGPKTATRVILELRDKLKGVVPLLEEKGVMPLPTAPLTPMKRDLLSALLNLGYKKHEAERAIEQTLSSLGEEFSFEDAIRGALKILARR